MPAATAPLAPAVAPLLVDVNVVAALVEVSPRTITRWSDAGLMPKGHKLGNLVRWSKAEIEKWVEDGCPKSVGAAK
jgi:predicted DNA-binding transcriptional regulator AlpA